jgi:hypothetical protein
MTSETANTAGTLRNSRISFLHRCCRLMMLLNVEGQISTIQRIISVIPIDMIDRSGRFTEWLCRVGSETRGDPCLRGCADLVGWDQPAKSIGFTIFIC